MKKEFIVERNGRAFVLYAGLLNLAHENGLKSIHTELLQIPSKSNDNVAIAFATVVLEKDGVERTYTGIGDAAPNNVGPGMQTCLIRMGETRAKARALRDAVNVGIAAFEELEEEEEAPVNENRPLRGPDRGSRASSFRPGQSPARTQSSRQEAGNPTLPITEAQKKAILSICKGLGLEPDAHTKECYDLDLDNLTQAQAGEAIRELSAKPKSAPPRPPARLPYPESQNGLTTPIKSSTAEIIQS